MLNNKRARAGTISLVGLAGEGPPGPGLTQQALIARPRSPTVPEAVVASLAWRSMSGGKHHDDRALAAVTLGRRGWDVLWIDLTFS